MSASAQKTFDALPTCEGRDVFTVAAAGRTEISLRRSKRKVEVTEILLECVSANTFQLLAGGRAVTPVFDFAARQSYVDAGFFLDPSEKLEIAAGGSGQIVGIVRWRPLDS